MNIDGKPWQSIWIDINNHVCVIDQTKLPHELTVSCLKSYEEIVNAISNMVVRGAPLIGIAGAYGLMLALQRDPSNKSLKVAFDSLGSARPTAVNLNWALQRIFKKVFPLPLNIRALEARKEADLIAKEDIDMCKSIGDFGSDLIKSFVKQKSINSQKQKINILTHCNAGWLATVDWGTALAPIYKAHREGINIHVWVDETRPRNQGASLTAFELDSEGIPHTLIVDNAGGHLMQNGEVDLVIVGADRVTRKGDVCNKIGTYLKALAAKDNDIPFFVAVPSSTIDFQIENAFIDVPIEYRSNREVTNISGVLEDDSSGKLIKEIKICPKNTLAINPAFDITPARLITSLITEYGLVEANEECLKKIILK